jgi:hypothetical protein
MKPGDLLEWNPHTFNIQNYILDDRDAASPFLVLTCTLVHEEHLMFAVEVLDSRGRKMRYDKGIIEEFARKLE